jgi:hypothetical protein
VFNVIVSPGLLRRLPKRAETEANMEELAAQEQYGVNTIKPYFFVNENHLDGRPGAYLKGVRLFHPKI